MREKGTLYFFTGLAGAGKSTIGGLFYEQGEMTHDHCFDIRQRYRKTGLRS